MKIIVAILVLVQFCVTAAFAEDIVSTGTDTTATTQSGGITIEVPPLPPPPSE